MQVNWIVWDLSPEKEWVPFPLAHSQVEYRQISSQFSQRPCHPTAVGRRQVHINNVCLESESWNIASKWCYSLRFWCRPFTFALLGPVFDCTYPTMKNIGKVVGRCEINSRPHWVYGFWWQCFCESSRSFRPQAKKILKETMIHPSGQPWLYIRY